MNYSQNPTRLRSLLTIYQIKINLLKEGIYKLIYLIDSTEKEINETFIEQATSAGSNNAELIEEFWEFASDNIDEMTEISKLYVGAMIIEGSALIERMIIQVSFIVQDIEQCPDAPDKENQSNYFTDSIKAMEYIDNLTQISLKKSHSWEKIKLLRDLRQKLAHGFFSFRLKPNEFKNYNAKFKTSKHPLLIKINEKNNLYECSLYGDIEILMRIGWNFLDFINEVETALRIKYSF
ncbi:hypothetical protein ISS06_00745 [Patescibacteria group bacterium]|nr:hypothetical protein [Patescibacteria group bacterium]